MIESNAMPSHSIPAPPRWMRYTLVAAAAYNLLWGAAVVLFPFALFDAIGMERPLYPGIWQCVGMIVGVYGIGYYAAARNPFVHWPITLVGLLGKIFGPIGFAIAVTNGELPWQFGLTILTNDLIWWAPFFMILVHAYNAHHAPRAFQGELPAFDDAIRSGQLATQRGQTLAELSNERPTIVIFLRHFGCTFCRETLADIARCYDAIKASNTQVCFVHMSDKKRASEVLSEYGLTDAHSISDPQRILYRVFGLRTGGFFELFGPKVFLRAVVAFVAGTGVGKLEGDGLQMPGAFLLHYGEIKKEDRHQSAADRVNLSKLGCVCGTPAMG